MKSFKFFGTTLEKTLLYSSHIQTTCARKHNEPSQDSYLATTLTGMFS